MDNVPEMAEDVIDITIKNFEMPDKPCITKELKLSRHDMPVAPVEITSLTNEELKTLIKKCITEEMCMTVEDFLSRRTRQLLLNANEAVKAAPLVTKLMAEEMSKDEFWITEQINNFNAIAKNYTP